MMHHTRTRPIWSWPRAGLLALSLVGGSACTSDLVSVPSTARGPTTAAGSSAVSVVAEPAPPVLLGTCSDVSASVDRAAVEQFHLDLADAVQAWRPLDIDGAGSSPELPALAVHARVIGAASYGQGSLIIDGVVPGVRALEPEPLAIGNESATAYRERHLEWETDKAQREAELVSSVAKAKELAEAIRSYPIVAEPGSEQLGCLSALRESFDHGTQIKAIMFSDLIQTLPPQVSGELHEMHILILQPCDKANTCTGLQDQWTGDLSNRGVESIYFARPETGMRTIADFLAS